MKKLLLKFSILVSALTGIGNLAQSQTTYHCQNMNIVLSGTSNIHDWDMKASSGQSELSVGLNAAGKISSISKLSFTLPAKTLKSDHSGMDNNTYKALRADKNPTLSFTMTSGTVKIIGDNNYLFTCVGNMNIAGTVKLTEITATGKYDPTEKVLLISGVKKTKMTTYEVKPPTALFGTIKTGDDISISYNVKYK